VAETTLCFVGAERGNAFMNELLAAVAHEVSELGMRTEVTFDAFPEEGSLAYVVIPHEYFACVDESLQPSKQQLGRTIAFCTEQPGTHWFELSASHARSAGAAVDIYSGAARELRRRGVRAEHFRLGYTAYWDAWRGNSAAERPVDVLHLGAVNPRRLRALAGYASTLWPYDTRLLIPPEKPKTEERADFLMGEAKWRLLASARTLLNLHRQESAYFEWVRVLEAVSNGCVVVSEHAADADPLVPGEHFVSGTLENLAFLADGLLRDEDRLSSMRAATYDLVRTELPMRPAAERLAALAERLARSPRRSRGPGRLPSSDARRTWLRVQDPRVEDVLWRQAQLLEWTRRSDAVLKKLVLGQMDLARKVASQVSPELDGGLELEVVARTPAYERANPRVSVLVPLYNHAEEVTAALTSVAASELPELEVVVLDDASTDGSRESAIDFLLANPYLPAQLLRHPVNRGLGRTRNDLVASARGELVFMLDADNEVYPTALSRLVDALDEDPGAFFAYSMLEEHEDGEPDTLRSCLPWDPERLAEQNYIDAMSLLRRDELVAIGGYTEDLRLHGWEDYDLWCRCLERGLRGVLVPQILARYRRAGHSMLASVTNLDVSEAESLLRARYPALATLAADG
jgi:hypothetical protein